MAGTITLSRTQQFNITTGELLRGGKLYFYQSGTTTPQNAYQDQSLATTFPNPYTLESDARVPFLWFADGSIRVRLTDSAGVVQFDDDNVPIVGSSGGGGGVDTTNPDTLFKTGYPLWVPIAGTLAGFVRLNGRTIGSATSGATERANADVEALFLYKWATYSDTYAPVTGGRGASAAADWAANKPIGLLDMRGRGPFGLDDMGNSAASRLTDTTFATPTTAASTGGVGRHTLASSEIPAHTHTVTVTDPGHLHAFTGTNSTGNWSGPGGNSLIQPSGSTNTASNTTGITAAANANTGGGGAHNTMPPGMLGSWYMKL